MMFNNHEPAMARLPDASRDSAMFCYFVDADLYTIVTRTMRMMMPRDARAIMR